MRLAYQAQAGGAADHGRLDMVEAEVQRLRGDLEASQRLKEELLRQETQPRSQIEALTSQVAGLKVALAVQETDLISASTAQNEAE